ncbi:MAG: alpha/beta fold hydrolase [Thermoanaerobaculia bacterium]|nr:alpha/beta fold hydrolase [Thermoanaerobaculia bacterium]
MARSVDEEDKRSRRWKLLAGLGLGALAIGAPAAWVHRRNRLTPPLRRHGIGRFHTWSWRGGDIAFDRTGERSSPIILLHSMGPGHDGWEWRAAAELLSGRHDLWIPDLPGWGHSINPHFDLEANLYVDFLEDFLVDVVAEASVIVAVGRAAGYALQVAARQPGRVRALALVNPRGLTRTGSTPTDRIARRLLDLPVLRPSALALLTSDTALHRHLEHEVFAAPERVDAAVLDHYARSARQPGADRAMAALMSGRLAPELSSLTLDPNLPIWLAWGRRCHAPAIEEADLWLQKFPEAYLEVFDDSGLLPHLEEAGRFSFDLDEFLTENAPIA